MDGGKREERRESSIIVVEGVKREKEREREEGNI